MTLCNAITGSGVGAQLRMTKEVAIQERGLRGCVTGKASKWSAFEESWSARSSSTRISDGAGDGLDFILPKL